MAMKVLIVEDELMAQKSLVRTLTVNFPDMEIVGTVGSVKGALSWLRNPANAVDVIFMDVELSDGECFEIFRQYEVKAKVIMTTAYDSYAIKAFEAGSIDYLLKPIKVDDVRHAIEKLTRLSGNERTNYKSPIDTMIESTKQNNQRVFLVHYKDKIIPLNIDDVAYFYISNERVTAVTLSSERYNIDRTLESLQATLPEDEFFRANRQFIIARKAVKDIAVWFGSRLSLNLSVETPEKIIISKARVPEFKQWLTSVHPSN
jgi:two-component system LytT family response regulator